MNSSQVDGWHTGPGPGDQSSGYRPPRAVTRPAFAALTPVAAAVVTFIGAPMAVSGSKLGALLVIGVTDVLAGLTGFVLGVTSGAIFRRGSGASPGRPWALGGMALGVVMIAVGSATVFVESVLSSLATLTW